MRTAIDSKMPHSFFRMEGWFAANSIVQFLLFFIVILIGHGTIHAPKIMHTPRCSNPTPTVCK